LQEPDATSSSTLRLRATGLVAVLAWACASTAKPAAPPPSPPAPSELECTYSASNVTRTVRVEPTQDPYAGKELDVAGRFALKFVYVASPEDVASFRVYAYELGDAGPLLLQEGKYLPPFATGASTARRELTGRQLVYGHELGRELAYSCAWVRP
jgi:hypothetical protein